jgi:phosphatidylserine/phosphatidylglycerophosphate/cardiolipin synthase-like enzyme
VLVSPFINSLADHRHSLAALSQKIASERVCTYVVTRKPVEPWQVEAVNLLNGNPWIEIRFNESLHAKVFIAASTVETESFALFGSGNLTGRAAAGNLEVGMMLLARGLGRPLVHQLHYWATNQLRILPETSLYKPIKSIRKDLCHHQHSATGSV